MEYIIYDKAEERFLDQHEASINKDGMIIFNGTTLTGTSRFTVHQLIPKTDINGKKIYIDSSIFKYDTFTVENFERVFHGKAIGYFTFDDDMLYYMVTDGYTYAESYDNYEMSNFEVIGTLQKDRHLLEENND